MHRAVQEAREVLLSMGETAVAITATANGWQVFGIRLVQEHFGWYMILIAVLPSQSRPTIGAPLKEPQVRT